MKNQPEPIARQQKPQAEELEYVGFWARLLASIIDTVLSAMVFYPILYAVFGKEYFISGPLVPGPGDFILTHILPAVAIIVFWFYKSATPGKMAIHAKIVDAKTGLPPSKKQLVGRYFAYYVSTIPLFMGFLWIAWDPRKQGWHDKLAGTVVVRPVSRGTIKVIFEN